MCECTLHSTPACSVWSGVRPCADLTASHRRPCCTPAAVAAVLPLRQDPGHSAAAVKRCLHTLPSSSPATCHLHSLSVTCPVTPGVCDHQPLHPQRHHQMVHFQLLLARRREGPAVLQRLTIRVLPSLLSLLLFWLLWLSLAYPYSPQLLLAGLE